MNALYKIFFGGIIAAAMPQMAEASSCSASAVAITCDTLDLFTAQNSLVTELSLSTSNALTAYQNNSYFINTALSNQNSYPVAYTGWSSNIINITNTFGLYVTGSAGESFSFSSKTVGNLIDIYATATNVYANITFSTTPIGMAMSGSASSSLNANEYLSGVPSIMVASYSGSIPTTGGPNMGGIGGTGGTGGNYNPVPGPIAGAGLPALLGLLGFGLYRRRSAISV